jgi:hypothetical protein
MSYKRKRGNHTPFWFSYPEGSVINQNTTVWLLIYFRKWFSPLAYNWNFPHYELNCNIWSHCHLRKCNLDLQKMFHIQVVMIYLHIKFRIITSKIYHHRALSPVCPGPSLVTVVDSTNSKIQEAHPRPKSHTENILLSSDNLKSRVTSVSLKTIVRNFHRSFYTLGKYLHYNVTRNKLCCNKHISQVCRGIYESFVQLFSMKQK